MTHKEPEPQTGKKTTQEGKRKSGGNLISSCPLLKPRPLVSAGQSRAEQWAAAAGKREAAVRAHGFASLLMFVWVRREAGCPGCSLRCTVSQRSVTKWTGLGAKQFRRTFESTVRPSSFIVYNIFYKTRGRSLVDLLLGGKIKQVQNEDDQIHSPQRLFHHSLLVHKRKCFLTDSSSWLYDKYLNVLRGFLFII